MYLYHANLTFGNQHATIHVDNEDGEENYIYSTIDKMLVARSTIESETTTPVSNIYEYLLRECMFVPIKVVAVTEEFKSGGYVEFNKNIDGYEVVKRIPSMFIKNMVIEITDFCKLPSGEDKFKVVYHEEEAVKEEQKKRKNNFFKDIDAVSKYMFTMEQKAPNCWITDSEYIINDTLVFGVINWVLGKGSIGYVRHKNAQEKLYVYMGVNLIGDSTDVRVASVVFNTDEVMSRPLRK